MKTNNTDFSKRTVSCYSVFGPMVQVPIEKMRFRTSVYGLIPDDGNLLLVRTKTTNQLTFPGGGIKLGETMQEALKREVSEETGIEIKIGELFHIQEEFFYFDPDDIGYHAFLFFFRCEPLTTNLENGTIIEDFRTHHPSWMPIDDLQPEDFLQGAQKALSIFLSS
jgi:8-oxo-dGTP pyrophosphatase MutT (NUDIX family)